jgi:hypothetical protein
VRSPYKLPKPKKIRDRRRRRMIKMAKRSRVVIEQALNGPPPRRPEPVPASAYESIEIKKLPPGVAMGIELSHRRASSLRRSPRLHRN